MKAIKEKRMRYERRRQRTARAISGSGLPRLSVYLSNRHLIAQVIDDRAGSTIAYVTDQALKLKQGLKKTEQAEAVGEKIAELAQAKGVTKVVFDRGGKRYHGRIKAVAEGARRKGLTF